jgi:hypothetical protein
VRLHHPPDSPDLAPCEFWLFGILKRNLEGHTFASAIEVRGEMNDILMKIPFDEFILVFDEWKCRLRECIDRGGEYLSTGQLSSLALVRAGKSYGTK